MSTCATTTIELEPFEELQARPSSIQLETDRLSILREDARDRESRSSRSLAESGGVEPDPAPRVDAAQKWNEPSINTFRVAACFWSLFVMGANDAAYGALIPSVITIIRPPLKLPINMTMTASRVLQLDLHHRIHGLHLAICRIRRVRHPQQLAASPCRTARCCHPQQ